jgi:hypothetical protein
MQFHVGVGVGIGIGIGFSFLFSIPIPIATPIPIILSILEFCDGCGLFIFKILAESIQQRSFQPQVVF